MTVKLSILVILSAVAAASNISSTNDSLPAELPEAAGLSNIGSVKEAKPEAIVDVGATTTNQTHRPTLQSFIKSNLTPIQLAEKVAKSHDYDGWLTLLKDERFEVAFFTGLYVDETRLHKYAMLLQTYWADVGKLLLTMSEYNCTLALKIAVRLGACDFKPLAKTLALDSFMKLYSPVNLTLLVDVVQYIDHKIAAYDGFIVQHGILTTAAVMVALVVKQHSNVDFLNSIESTLANVYNKIPNSSSVTNLKHNYSRLLSTFQRQQIIDSEGLFYFAERFAIALKTLNGDRQLKYLVYEERHKFEDSKRKNKIST